ncbi:Uncharacterised protein [Mycobacteroides abscessus subsp. abscessus]|nr:Uncharacterised protein [Mycobacteroides abscessus subsp. abscessus]
MRQLVRTTKKTTLKICWLPSTPARRGKVANTIGTAPLSPAQERKMSSFVLYPILIVDKKTAAGLAINIRIAEMAMPFRNISRLNSSEGNTSRPRITNIMICIIQANPSEKRKMVCL